MDVIAKPIKMEAMKENEKNEKKKGLQKKGGCLKCIAYYKAYCDYNPLYGNMKKVKNVLWLLK